MTNNREEVNIFVIIVFLSMSKLNVFLPLYHVCYLYRNKGDTCDRWGYHYDSAKIVCGTVVDKCLYGLEIMGPIPTSGSGSVVLIAHINLLFQPCLWAGLLCNTQVHRVAVIASGLGKGCTLPPQSI